MRLVAAPSDEQQECSAPLDSQCETPVPTYLKALDSTQRDVLCKLLDGNHGERIVTIEERKGNTSIEQCDGDSVPAQSMPPALQNAGISRETLANVLFGGLNARKHVVVAGKLKRVPDHSVRIKYLELAHKLAGDFTAAPQRTGQSESYETRILTVMERVKREAEREAMDTIEVR